MLGEIGGACLLLLVIYAFAGWHWYHHPPPKIPARKKLVYARYIKSGKWKNKAKKCKEDANFTCSDCGITQMDLHKRQLGQWLHAHHLTYKRLGDELPEDLLCLCPDCHNKRHGR